MSNEHREQARAERLFAVVGDNGALWTTFDTREKAEGYPGPRMLELAPRSIVEYVPASALSSRDAEVREVLERLQHLPPSDPPCWCWVKWTTGEHDGPCRAARDLYSKLQAPELQEEKENK